MPAAEEPRDGKRAETQWEFAGSVQGVVHPAIEEHREHVVGRRARDGAARDEPQLLVRTALYQDPARTSSPMLDHVP